MSLSIKEMRMKTGLSQAKFAETFNIPVSTLRKWEQGDSSPSGYVIDLIARAIPSLNSSLEEISGRNNAVYYYDRNKKQLIDNKGNTILVKEDLEGVNRQNLRLYVSDLFESFYEIQNKFERDCYYDKQDDIVWTE